MKGITMKYTEQNLSSIKETLIAQYKFDDHTNLGKDSSGNGHHAMPLGTKPPSYEAVNHRVGATLHGGPNGSSYFQLPSNVLASVNDYTGITVSTWVNFGIGLNVWERIYDFGKSSTGPYMFMTRNLRSVCYNGDDIAVDPGKSFPPNEWFHIACTMYGTKGGTLSSAGPILYLNGELISDGSISQTSSGTYAKLRHWLSTFDDPSNYTYNYIGKSQYDVDPNFDGSLSDFRIYNAPLTQDDIITLMCESLSDDEIITLARDKYLSLPSSIITEDINLPTSLMGGKVKVVWSSSQCDVISNEGVIQNITTSNAVTLTATLNKGSSSLDKTYNLSVLPKDLPPYTLTVHGDKDVIDVSSLLYGLFYEDINNAADGGIYAELVQNRSFEAFHYDTYSLTSGENASSSGRIHHCLEAWSGDLNRVHPKMTGGLNEFFGLEDAEINSCYVTVEDGATLCNRGFSDANHHCSMAIIDQSNYTFTIWAKAAKESTITLSLKDSKNNSISNTINITIDGDNTWKKYGVNTPILLTASNTTMGQLSMTFAGEVSIDMVSLVPEDVWGFKEEATSISAHMNFKSNPNYRLRKDLVETLVEMHPKFLRFPGGCISEGSYIWDNVYDWKQSVNDIELRKENFNVWGYMMTMGLGYMEYFQLAEDLNCTPLPVMACGVLCQARSDYANPAGGCLRDYYVSNFTDLIDFAISTDFENNEWAKLRQKMGHEKPFDLHYLGVGNENWGAEFYANFEYFKTAIDQHMVKHHPGYQLHIISTVGAQADDDAYQQGWKFLSGRYDTPATLRFTDGHDSIEETMEWYKDNAHYMDTIADEHFYRSNDYLKLNCDRYNYYHRAYREDGTLDESLTSKVFVGEYASSDKNTLAGAVAEAAIMTSFENNSDVVRLTAYAPLFHKMRTDGLYRWTPDCIWFDDETVWRTPNYYVQQLFAKYLGTKVLGTSFSTYHEGKERKLQPYGGIEIATGNAYVIVHSLKVISNVDGRVLLEQDFTKELNSSWQVIPGSVGFRVDAEKGLILYPQATGLNGLYMLQDSWTNYHVVVKASKYNGTDGFYIGVGLTNIQSDKKDVLEYAIGYQGDKTGLKVHKQGVEAYTLGDYSSSTAAGNLRATCYQEINLNTTYTIQVNYGGNDGKHILCSYTDGENESYILDYKLEAYNSDVYHSVTKDDSKLYIKLVNPDTIQKQLRLQLADFPAIAIAHHIVLTGDNKLLNKANVNKKNNELVVPVESQITFQNNEAILHLDANSVHVLVCDLS